MNLGPGVEAALRAADSWSMETKTFRPRDVDQQMLFPPSVKDFVSPDHWSQFIRDLVREDLDLCAIYARCGPAWKQLLYSRAAASRKAALLVA